MHSLLYVQVYGDDCILYRLTDLLYGVALRSGAYMSKNEKIEIYEDQPVRTAWNETEEEWYFSIVDTIRVLTDSKDPLAY